MRFVDLVTTSAAVAAVSGRLDKIHRLADLLTRLESGEVETAVAFLSGTARQGRIGIGHAAIAAASDVPSAGEPALDIGDVDAALATLSKVSGKGSAGERVRVLRALFARATEAEQDFLRRLLYGELRQGALEGVLLEAVARAAKVAPPLLRRAAMMAGDLGPVARAALAGGAAALDAVAMQVMRPIQPMLAESEASVEEALERLDDATLEYKLDGARVQVHKAEEVVRIFSRSLRDVTDAVPEVVALVRALPARELILDGEVIALRPDGRPEPFQITMRRFGRKLDVEKARADLPLTPFFFDCLYADGTVLLDEPQERRIQVLHDTAGAAAVPRVIRPTRAEADAFARAALDAGHEGVMAKALSAPYAAGRRGASWLKVKRPRTLDLVVLAVEWGHGRRHGWLSNLHLGARDPESHSFVMLGKTFKGMTDEMLTWQTEKLLALEIGRDAYTVHVRPELVVEVAFNEIQDSPIYPGGLALALRARQTLSARQDRRRGRHDSHGADDGGPVAFGSSRIDPKRWRPALAGPRRVRLKAEATSPVQSAPRGSEARRQASATPQSRWLAARRGRARARWSDGSRVRTGAEGPRGPQPARWPGAPWATAAGCASGRRSRMTGGRTNEPSNRGMPTITNSDASSARRPPAQREETYRLPAVRSTRTPANPALTRMPSAQGRGSRGAPATRSPSISATANAVPAFTAHCFHVAIGSST